jgi:hypothetical protein
MNNSPRRTFLRNLSAAAAAVLLPACNRTAPSGLPSAASTADPADCDYAPCGEYIKDHSFVFHDGWYHFFSISGIQGYYHGYNGNEETVSWSISRDLVNWEMRGHVLHATQRKGAFDQHEIWAPFCCKSGDRFYMFYTGIIHPVRPMEYRKLGHDHPWVAEGHKETQGLALSDDLTFWDKVSDFHRGLGIPGRDSYVTHDEANHRWLLYSTLGTHNVHVAESRDLLNWSAIGECAEFPALDPAMSFGATTDNFGSGHHYYNSAESLTVMQHPLTGRWIMLGNWQYIISDDPLKFDGANARLYDREYDGKPVDLGFACEVLQHNGKWYRSGAMGVRDYWRLGFTEIEWVEDGAFKVVRPSRIARKYII